MMNTEISPLVKGGLAPLKLPKSLIKFFRDHEIPQIVILELGSVNEEKQSHSRFICNSVILALHSDKFERVISAGSQVIFLEGFNDETGVDTVRQCIEFMHGESLAVDKCGDLLGMLRFAENWEIPSLRNACFNKMKSKMVNLQLIPDSEFFDEQTFLKFKSVLLDEHGGSKNYVTQSNVDHRTSSDKIPKHLPGQSQEKRINIKCDDNASLLQRAIGGNSNSSSSNSSSGNKSSKPQNGFKYGLQKKLIANSKNGKKLIIQCSYAVKDYPKKIQPYPLYSGLDIIAQMVSTNTKLSSKNLVKLLSPFFKNSSVAACILEDIRDIALEKCSDQSNSLQKVLSTAMDTGKRVETYSVSKHFHSVSEFVENLTADKRINLHLDHGILCQICHGGTNSICENSASKIARKQINCVLKNLDIDFSSEETIDFISDKEFHGEHIIHCYLIGMSTKNKPISYVSLLQLRVAEIVEKIKGKVSRVKVVVVFSRKEPASSSLFRGKLISECSG